MLEINGRLMSKDTVVADVKNDKVEIINKSLVPLFFRDCKYLSPWLETRAIDAHRPNSRLLKKALRIKNGADIPTVLTVNAVSLTDNYWFLPAKSELTWDDVKFKDNLFDELALKGDFNSFNQPPSRTPELTNIGSFEKCWKRENGDWWLYKSGNENEYFSELFIYELGKKLDFDMAVYQYNGMYVKSLDFTNGNNVNFEPMYNLVKDNDDYEFNYQALQELNEYSKTNLTSSYLKMIYIDTICFNVDRHTFNYGYLRDANTGEILKMAPNYDNNISLISRGYADVSRKNDTLICFFTDFLKENPVAMNEFLSLKIPKINEKMIEDCLCNIPIKVNESYIKTFILNGQQNIEKEINKYISRNFYDIER